MPFDYPPGQVLSSVPSSSDKRRSSKLGGCAGVLFQIFHGKRLFPRKSLPAERPKQTASNHTDDKLPIAKLLLIADENSSGPLEDADEEVEVQDVAKGEAFEKKAPRTTPGLVARLMGLETMPSPESVCGGRKHSELRTNIGYQSPADAQLQDRHTSAPAAVQSYRSLRRAKTRDFKTDLPAKFAARQKKNVSNGVSKSKALVKSPSLSPHRFDASFPSSVKGDSLNKNYVRTHKSADSLEPAPKMLGANPQPNRQNRSERFPNSLSQNTVNPKSQLTKSAAQAPCHRRDDVNAVQVAPHYTSNEMISRRQIADVQKTQLSQQHTLNSSKCLPHEATLAKRKHGAQGELGQPKADITGKLKPDWRRQEETSRRLSQPTVSSTLRSQRARLSRHPIPPKSFQDSSGGACSSQASNCMSTSSEGTLASQLIKSQVGSNKVSAAKLSSSSATESVGKHEDTDDYADTKQPLEPIHNKNADLSRGKTTVLKNLDASYAAEYSQFSQDESSSSAIYTESLQRSSLESSISSDPSLSEFTSSSEECSNSLVGENIKGHERGEGTWKDDHNKLDGMKRASDFFLSESSSENLSDSLTVSSAGDSASLHAESDANSRSVDSAHPYSARNTAAILQELLTALSSSTSQRESSFDKKPWEGTESCSSESEFRQVEEPQLLPAGYVQCTGNFCMESTFQDCASSNSSDSSQLSQGNEECEMDSATTSKDCASNAELQAEDRYLPETPARGRINMQHGLSRDCEALMSTLSRLHHIDPEVIGLKARTEKLHSEEVVASGDGLSKCLLGSSLFDKPEEQIQWGLSSSTSLTADDDADSIYRSDIESSFRSAHDEVAAWNKKLVTDCLNEAFKSLSKQIYKFSSSLFEQSSATHVLSRVYKQLDEWRGMATNMNLDDMVEKEMNSTTRSWRSIGIETEEVAEVVESAIFSGLLEEVLLELI